MAEAVIISDSDDDIIFIPPPSPPFQNLDSSTENGFIEELNIDCLIDDAVKLYDKQKSGHVAIESMQIDENSTNSNGNDDDDDDVVYIPGPKPPLLVLDSSEDEPMDASDRRNYEPETMACALDDTNLIEDRVSKKQDKQLMKKKTSISKDKHAYLRKCAVGSANFDLLKRERGSRSVRSKKRKSFDTRDLSDSDVIFDEDSMAPTRTKQLARHEKKGSKRSGLKKRKSAGTICDFQNEIDEAAEAMKRAKKVAKNVDRNYQRFLLKKQRQSGSYYGSKDSDDSALEPTRTKRDSKNVKRISCKTLCEYNQNPSMNIYIDLHSSLFRTIPDNQICRTNESNKNYVGRSSNNLVNTVEEENWDDEDEPTVKGGDQNHRQNTASNRNFVEKSTSNSGNTIEEENWDEDDEPQKSSMNEGDRNCRENDESRNIVQRSLNNCGNTYEEENWDEDDEPQKGADQNWRQNNESNRNIVQRITNNYVNTNEEENWDEEDEGIDQNCHENSTQNQPSNRNFVQRSSSNGVNTIEEENWDEDDDCVEKAIVGRRNGDDCVRGKPFNIHANKRGNNEHQTSKNDFNEWPIVEEDVHYVHATPRGLTCFNCHERGHRMSDCPQPRKRIVCYTCGQIGHSKTRCPNAICLKCGARTDVYSRGCKQCQHLANLKCKNCGIRGHDEQNCTDNWRRYHNTIDTMSTPHPVPIPKSTNYCSVCAGAGHTAELCYDAIKLLGEEMPSTRIQKYGPDFTTNMPRNHRINTARTALGPATELAICKSLSKNKNRRYSYQPKVERNDVKMVLNPMNSKMMINPFSKKFHLASSTSTNESDGSSVYSSVDKYKPKNQISFQEFDLTMKKAMNVMNQNVNTANALAHNALLHEAIEIDKLRFPALNANATNATRKMKELTDAEQTLCFLKRHLTTLFQSEDKVERKVNTSEILKFSHVKETKEDLDLNLADGNQLTSSVISSNNDFDEKWKSDDEKKITLTKDHSRLLTEDNEMINDTLTVIGSKDFQDNVHADLVEHSQDQPKKKHLRNEIFKVLPMSRKGLIAFIQQHIDELEQPWDNVEELYNNVKINENLKCKSANEIRKQLNINLFGRAGLRDGILHLVGLQDNLEVLKNTEVEMSKELWKDVYKHFRYIFSSHTHDNYPELISAFNDLKNVKYDPQFEGGHEEPVVDSVIGN